MARRARSRSYSAMAKSSRSAGCFRLIRRLSVASLFLLVVLVRLVVVVIVLSVLGIGHDCVFSSLAGFGWHRQPWRNLHVHDTLGPRPEPKECVVGVVRVCGECAVTVQSVCCRCEPSVTLALPPRRTAYAANINAAWGAKMGHRDTKYGSRGTLDSHIWYRLRDVDSNHDWLIQSQDPWLLSPACCKH